MFKILCYFISLTIFCACQTTSFKEDNFIEIIRDNFGVPHIYAPTDEQVAYGLAWTQCEDDFNTIQEQMAAIKGVFGEVKGKDGLIADFAIKFMGIKDYAREHYDELSPKMRMVIESFVSGLNTYALKYPEKVLDNDIFPIENEIAAAGFMLGLVEITGATQDLQNIMEGKISQYVKSNFPKGSNAIAINPNKTQNGESYLAINSHQPLEGWYSWYEAHLVSEEGMNIHGGTFPGGPVIFHGANEYLAWAHTVNHADFSDVYKLEMHPDKSLTYKYDDQWLQLEEEKLWSWLKIAGPICIPIRRTIYKSVYGTTFETDDGFFVWRFVAGEALMAVQQWYEMNKAKSLGDFKSALYMQGIPSTNIIYADSKHNIFYISNAKLPKRDSSYQWREVILGNTSKSQWQGYHDIDDLPQVLNPDCGYVFNTNNTPYSSTCENANPIESKNNKTMGFLNPGQENSRSMRFMELISSYDSISYADFKTIKYDNQYPDQMMRPKLMNLEALFDLNPSKYPEIKDAITVLQNWNRNTNVENVDAMLYLLVYKNLSDYLKEHQTKRGTFLIEDAFVSAIKSAQDEMMADHGTLQVPLGEIQRHIRGDVNMPLAGGPDVLGAIYCSKTDDNQYRAVAGESFIQLVRFTEDGKVKIETVNAFGTSANPNSPHYTDQMELFANQKLKPVWLERDSVLAHATSRYHPWIILD